MKVLLFFVMAVALFGVESRRPVTDISSFFVTSERRAMVEQADTLEATLLAPKEPHASPPSEKFSDYLVTKHVVIPADKKKEILALLTSPATYRWPDEVMPDGTVRTSVLGGWYGYHVRLTARKGDDSLDFGVSCHALITIWKGDSHISTALYRQRHDRLFEILRALFPDDARLLRLEQSRR